MTRRIALAAAALLIALNVGCAVDRPEREAEARPTTPPPKPQKVLITKQCDFSPPGKIGVSRRQDVTFENKHPQNCEVTISTNGDATLFGRALNDTIPQGGCKTYTVNPNAAAGEYDVTSDCSTCPTPTPKVTPESTVPESEEPIETFSRATFVIKDPPPPPID